MTPDTISHVISSQSASRPVAPVNNSVVAAKGAQQTSKDGSVTEQDTQAVSTAEESVSSQKRDLKEAVSKINDYVQNLKRDLAFSIDEVSGKTVITVTDPESDEVIRQIPSEEMLQIARYFAEKTASEAEDKSKGLLFVKQV